MHTQSIHFAFFRRHRNVFITQLSGQCDWRCSCAYKFGIMRRRRLRWVVTLIDKESNANCVQVDCLLRRFNRNIKMNDNRYKRMYVAHVWAKHRTRAPFRLRSWIQLASRHFILIYENTLLRQIVWKLRLVYSPLVWVSRVTIFASWRLNRDGDERWRTRLQRVGETIVDVWWEKYRAVKRCELTNERNEFAFSVSSGIGM